jgi:hypothetical protein
MKKIYTKKINIILALVTIFVFGIAILNTIINISKIG